MPGPSKSPVTVQSAPPPAAAPASDTGAMVLAVVVVLISAVSFGIQLMVYLGD